MRRAVPSAVVVPASHPHSRGPRSGRSRLRGTSAAFPLATAFAAGLATLLVTALLPGASAAAEPETASRNTTGPDRTEAAAPPAAEIEAADRSDDPFRALGYRLVGPFRGGRVTAVAGVRGTPGTYYMGATGGGVWKTTDYGETWANVSDLRRPDPEAVAARPMGRQAGGARAGMEAGTLPVPRKVRRGGDAFGTASIGAVTVAESDPNVVWVGTGSACIRGNVSPGDGVYRSTDGGRTWYDRGLPEAGQIGRIAVHPADPDTAWVAALGHAFGANPERGVYRTRDGGATWENVLWVSDTAGAVDLALDPTNPRILYAATWEAVRKPWDMISGGPGSGLFKSTDGGDSWVELTEGLPEGIKGRIGVAVSRARPNRVYALVEHAEEAGLYRSDDGGESFRRVSSDANLTQRPWYYMHVQADPKDPETVWVLNVQMWRSTDGGKSFTPVSTPHADNHDLWIDPDDPRIMVQGNDGGANVTTNGGRTWSTQANQPTAEMYRVSVDEQHPYWIYGGQQDNSTVGLPSRSPDRGIERHHWYAPGGCESGHVAVDPEDPDVTFAGCYGGTIERFDRDTGHSEQVMAWPQLAVGTPGEGLRYRFQWNAPIRVSKHDPSVLYHLSNHVHRSTDEGKTWQVVSPDLTRDDPDKQVASGGPISKDVTGVEIYGTIFAFEESPHRKGLLWAGSDDGRVHVSDDDGATWRDVTPAAMPEWGTVNMIEPSAHDPGRVFLAVHRYRMDDFRPYVFRTDDGGASWRLLTDGSNGIPADHFVRAVREDPERKGLLYAGGEFGMYASFDDGATWRSLQLDLPVTPVTDLAVHRGDLVVATQGRSFWILDDLGPLRQWSAEAAAAPAWLYTPEDVVLYPGSGGGGRDRGENPPRGAVLLYSLGEDLSEKGAREVTVEIRDGAGEVLRSLSSQEEEEGAPNPFLAFFPELARPRTIPAEKGLNRWVWDLRLPDAKLVDDAVLWGDPSGPEVPPGDYRVRLTVAAAGDAAGTPTAGGESADGGSADGGRFVLEATFRVLQDPRLDVPPEESSERFRLSREIHAALSRNHRALDTLRTVRSHVAELAERVAGGAETGTGGEETEPDGTGDLVRRTARSVKERLDALETRLTQPKAKAVQDVLNHPPQIDNQLLFLYNTVETAEGRPTAAAYERFSELEAELDGLLAELATVLDTELAAFNRAVEERATAPVPVDAGGWRGE